MAIDSEEKRWSVMGLGKPFVKIFPPTGAVDQPMQMTMLDLYSGFELDGFITPLPGVGDAAGLVQTLGFPSEIRDTLGLGARGD